MKDKKTKYYFELKMPVYNLHARIYECVYYLNKQHARYEALLVCVIHFILTFSLVVNTPHTFFLIFYFSIQVLQLSYFLFLYLRPFCHNFDTSVLLGFTLLPFWLNLQTIINNIIKNRACRVCSVDSSRSSNWSNDNNYNRYYHRH